MKRIHIALLVLVAVAIAVMSASLFSFTTYETFASAVENKGKSVKVVGFLDKSKGIKYDPKVDPNKFTFYATDKKGTMYPVVFINGAPPRDIEKSEQLVMSGFIDGNTFVCSGIQMKCPSKYKKDMVIGKEA